MYIIRTYPMFKTSFLNSLNCNFTQFTAISFWLVTTYLYLYAMLWTFLVFCNFFDQSIPCFKFQTITYFRKKITQWIFIGVYILLESSWQPWSFLLRIWNTDLQIMIIMMITASIYLNTLHFSYGIIFNKFTYGTI